MTEKAHKKKGGARSTYEFHFVYRVEWMEMGEWSRSIVFVWHCREIVERKCFWLKIMSAVISVFCLDISFFPFPWTRFKGWKLVVKQNCQKLLAFSILFLSVVLFSTLNSVNKNLYRLAIERFEVKISLPIVRKEEKEE